MTYKLLISLAHPDDESFGWGGLIAKYVQAGVAVRYICGTDGSRGTVAEEYIARYGSVAATRQAELHCAAQTLGFEQVYQLGYRDSGMMGAPENDDPDSLWQADVEEVADKIAQVILDWQPHVVLTFDPYGGYGHPDHIAMHKATTHAYYAVAESHRPPKLYYASFPRKLLERYIADALAKGEDPRKMGVNKDLDLVAIRDHLLPVTTWIDVRDYLDVWDEASRCHASQVNPRMQRPRTEREALMGRQSLTRIEPPFAEGTPSEDDLFAGLDA